MSDGEGLLGEVSERAREGGVRRGQHTLTWKVIQDTRNTQDNTRHIQEAPGNTQAR